MEAIQIITFRLNENYFGIDIMKIREIMKLVPITKIAMSASYVSGVINVRGKIVAVIDTKAKIGMKCNGETDESRLLLVEKEGRVFGLMVDEVSEVISVSSDNIESMNIENEIVCSNIITGIIKLDNQLLTLINSDELI